MLLVIDVGNTNIVFAAYNGKTRLAAWRCRTDSGQTSDEYSAFLSQMFLSTGITFQDISDVIMSSVVPAANFHLIQFCEKHFNVRPHIVDYALIKDKLMVLLEKPEDVGADRLVNALAVKIFYQTPAVVVDFGTATTFDVIDQKGAYLGGSISTGINLSLDALHRAAAKLPKVDVRQPSRVIGQNTVEAMQSGIFWGYVSLVEGMISKISQELGAQPLVIATGGLAPLIAKGTQSIQKLDDELTIKGLLHLSQTLSHRQAAE